MSQADLLPEEGDAWWKRNKDKLHRPDTDPVLEIIEQNEIQFTRVLEIGCADGWRLEEIRKRYEVTCSGYDVSYSALHEGRIAFPQLHLHYGAANRLRYSENNEFDLVICGFFLYLADRRDLFTIVAEADRVLQDGGHLCIFDFYANWPHTVRYAHDPRIRTFKMPYYNLWTGNPAYHIIHQSFDTKEQTEVNLLQKNLGVWEDNLLC